MFHEIGFYPRPTMSPVVWPINLSQEDFLTGSHVSTVRASKAGVPALSPSSPWPKGTAYGNKRS